MTSRLWLGLWLILTVTSVVLAATRFHAPSYNMQSLPSKRTPLNTTAPREGWISSPNTRGTMTIIFTCLKALLIPLYSAFHVDIPTYPAGSFTRLCRRFKWMVVGLIMPEIAVVLSLAQHSDSQASKDSGLFERWTLTHGFYITMGGFVIVRNNNQRLPVNFKQLVTLKQHRPDFIPWLSTLTRESISDKSKADALVKIIALTQTIYLLAQVIGRAVQGLPISPLETVTAAYVPVTALIYIAWWNKPQDVAVPMEIHVGDFDVTTLPGWIESGQSQKLEGWTSVVISRMRAKASTSDIHLNAFALLLASVFGGIHITAWNFAFPTSIEQRLWRLAAVFALICGVCFHIVANTLRRVLLRKPPPNRQSLTLSEHFFPTLILWIYDHVGYLLLPMYTFSRIYILFESVYSLRSLPEETYLIPNWAQYVPN